MTETITRIDIAEDQLILASLLGYEKDLTDEDQHCLSVAIDSLTEILKRHQAKN
jgi:hypothetical protein